MFICIPISVTNFGFVTNVTNSVTKFNYGLLLISNLQTAKSNSLAPNASTDSNTQETISYSCENTPLRECSIQLAISPSLSASNSETTSLDITSLNEAATVSQEGLPRDLPMRLEDPLFTRPVVRLESVSVQVRSLVSLHLLSVTLMTDNSSGVDILMGYWYWQNRKFIVTHELINYI